MSPMRQLNITIVGAGRVGRALGTNLLGLGHAVRYAVRSPRANGVPDGATTTPVDDCADGADLVVLAVPFGTVDEVVPRLGLRAGDVLVDTTNPFGAPVPAGRASAAAVVAAAAGAGVYVVKAFNVLGAEHMARPQLPDGHRPVLPVAADDPQARALVVELVGDMGFDAVDVGDLGAAGILEEAARYWGLLAFAGGLGRQFVLVAHQRP